MIERQRECVDHFALPPGARIQDRRRDDVHADVALETREHRARIFLEVGIEIVLLGHLAQVGVGQHDALQVRDVLVGVARAA
jgi:hypothetical protein